VNVEESIEPKSVNLKLVHAFDVKIDFDKRLVGAPMPGGARQGYTSVKSGLVRGPRLNGVVMDFSGADWATVRTDGVVELNAHYLLQADDGALIYIKNLGYVYSPVSAGEPVGGAPVIVRPGYFRCTPYFRAPDGRHEWLNRTVLVGGGERHTDPDYTLFRYYTVE
jgi:hypothetical protein